MGFSEQDQGSRGESLGFSFFRRHSVPLDQGDNLRSAGFLGVIAILVIVCFSGTVFYSGAVGPKVDSIQNAYSYSLSEIRDMARKDNNVLNGAPAELILSLFQTPETIRSDHPVVVWQYRASSCVLDIYLSLGEDQAPQNVLYSEVRARDPEVDGVAWGDCVPALLDRPLHFAALDSG